MMTTVDKDELLFFFWKVVATFKYESVHSLNLFISSTYVNIVLICIYFEHFVAQMVAFTICHLKNVHTWYFCNLFF